MDVLGVDGAGYVQVLDGGVVDVAEGGKVVLIGRAVAAAVVESERLAIAVEGAAERMVVRGKIIAGAAASYARHGDIGTKFHGLIAETAPRRVVFEGEAEGGPAVGIIDGVGMFGGAVVARTETDLNALGLRGGLQGLTIDVVGTNVTEIEVTAVIFEIFPFSDADCVTIILTGVDVVGGVTPTEGDVAFSVDAPSAVGVDRAAVDGEVAPPIRLDANIAVGVDRA